MKIERLDEKTVKVLLSRLDMNNFNMTYNEMDYKSPDTKRILIKLLEEVKQQIKLDLTTGKLFIEAFPYADGGCMLYVNMLESGNPKLDGKSSISTKTAEVRAFDTPIICKLSNLSDLTLLCEKLSERYGHMILKSLLYLINEKYYLIVYTYCKMDKEITRLLCEYGKLYGKGSVSVALVFEHGKELIEKDAIEIILHTLSDV